MLVDESEVLDDIAGVLWRNLYERNENMDEQHVIDLAKYVRNEQLSLLEFPIQAIYDGRIQWSKVPWKSSSKFNKRVGNNKGSLGMDQPLKGQYICICMLI